jgi:hypothetical protein
VEFSRRGKNGALEKHRSRIVAKGHLQKKDIDDYFESLHLFSARMTTMQCVRSSAHLYQYQSESTRKQYPGYPLEDDECLELHPTIYGLKQSPRAYYLLCKRVYTEIGLTHLKSDECCFILVKNNVKNGHKIPENFEAFLC